MGALFASASHAEVAQGDFDAETKSDSLLMEMIEASAGKVCGTDEPPCMGKKANGNKIFRFIASSAEEFAILAGEMMTYSHLLQRLRSAGIAVEEFNIEIRIALN